MNTTTFANSALFSDSDCDPEIPKIRQGISNPRKRPFGHKNDWSTTTTDRSSTDSDIEEPPTPTPEELEIARIYKATEECDHEDCSKCQSCRIIRILNEGGIEVDSIRGVNGIIDSDGKATCLECYYHAYTQSQWKQNPRRRNKQFRSDYTLS